MEQKDYRIVRTIREVYHVDARSREEASVILSLEGRVPSEVTIVKETVREINKKAKR